MNIYKLITNPEAWKQFQERAFKLRDSIHAYAPHFRRIPKDIDHFFKCIEDLRGCHHLEPYTQDTVISFTARYELQPRPGKLPTVSSVDRFIIPEMIRGKVMHSTNCPEHGFRHVDHGVVLQDIEIANEVLSDHCYGLRIGTPEEIQLKNRCHLRHWCGNYFEDSPSSIVLCEQWWDYDDLFGGITHQAISLIQICFHCLSTETIACAYKRPGFSNITKDIQKDWFDP